MNLKIIAETAFNHMGSLDYFNKMREELVKIGAEYVTFQIFKTDSFCVNNYSKKKFSEMVELDYDKWEYICKSYMDDGVTVIPCFLDLHSFNKLKHLNFDIVKIHSTDMFNYDLIEAIIEYSPSELIVETQVCTVHEIDKLVNSLENFKGEVTIFHGFSDYPTGLDDQNLNMLDYIKQKYDDCNIGFADHTLSVDVIPLMALSKNIKYLEKHITLKRSDKDFDYQVSIEVDDFAKMIENIKKYEKVLGHNNKFPVENEQKYKGIIHKKPVLKKAMKEGDTIFKNDCIFLRADDGIPAGHFGRYINKIVNNDLPAMTVLNDKNFKQNRLVIPIIARLKSSRLKEKVIKEIDGMSIIKIIIERLLKVKYDNVVFVLATSNLKEDDPLEVLAKECGIECFRGSPDNVLERLVGVVEKYNADFIVRVTGDNILTDFNIIDDMIDEYIKNPSIDYIRTNGLPLGISPELFSTSSLYKIYDYMGNPYISEYLTIFANKPELYEVVVLKYSSSYYSFNNHFSVDTIEDFSYVKKFSSYLKEIDKTIVESNLDHVRDFIMKYPVDESSILNKSFKLPMGKVIKYSDFINELAELEKKSKVIIKEY